MAKKLNDLIAEMLDKYPYMGYVTIEGKINNMRIESAYSRNGPLNYRTAQEKVAAIKSSLAETFFFETNDELKEWLQGK